MLEDSPDVTGFDLNRWAYFLLRLQLFRAAVPLAKRALVTAGTPDHFPVRLRSILSKDDHVYNLAGCRDTLGWGLCFECRYSQAEALLTLAVTDTQRYTSDQREVNYHLVHALFWGDKPEEARELVGRMVLDSPKDLWTKRAADLVASAPPIRAPIAKRNYDVVISFAGEDRTYAAMIAKGLVAKGLKVFYDDFERPVLWGHNLYEYLSDLYQNQARYSVALISKHYARKRWAQLEWKAIQARCFRECEPYCLPVRLDGTELAGLLPTTAYLSVERDDIDGIVAAIASKCEEM